MNDLEFIFDRPEWEQAFADLQPGDSLSAVRFLTVLEQEEEETVQEAFEMLTQRHIALDINSLPKFGAEGETQMRLQQEEKLVKSGQLLDGLEKNDPLRYYLEEVALLPVAGDPALLAQQMIAGKEAAAQSLADLMLGKVIGLAQEYVGKGVLLMDLIQEANLGLWQCIQSYESGDFKRQCVWLIRQYLAGAVTFQARQSGVGQKMRRAVEDYRSVDERLLAELGRNPTLEEIAEGLHMTPEEASTVAEMLSNARTMQRVKQPEPEQLPQEEDQAVEDTAYFQMRQRIAELLSGLPEEDAQLLTLRYGLEGGIPMDAGQVAARLGMTTQEVNDREAAALAKLRQHN